MRKVPEHWDTGIEEARSAVDRAIIHFQEQHDTLNFERAWKLFTFFDALVIGAVPRKRGGRAGQGNSSLNHLFTTRLCAFWSGAWAQLFMEIDSNRAPTKPTPQAQSDEAKIARTVRNVESLVASNAVSKAISRVSSDMSFASGPDVPDKLRAKFTQRESGTGTPLPPTSPEVLQELIDHIEEELWHLPNMRGPGPTGTTYEHIHAKKSVPQGPRLKATVLAMLPAATAPAEAIRVHRSAKLSPSIKKDALGQPTDDIRPLSSGSSHWRVAMRGWVKMFSEEAQAAVGKTQYGIGRKGACVSLRHDMLIEWALRPHHQCMGIDLANMHNRVKVPRLEHVVLQKVPRMAQLVGWMRAPRTHAYKDEHGKAHIVTSTGGLDQECPACTHRHCGRTCAVIGSWVCLWIAR